MWLLQYLSHATIVNCCCCYLDNYPQTVFLDSAVDAWRRLLRHSITGLPLWRTFCSSCLVRHCCFVTDVAVWPPAPSLQLWLSVYPPIIYYQILHTSPAPNYRYVTTIRVYLCLLLVPRVNVQNWNWNSAKQMPLVLSNVISATIPKGDLVQYISLCRYCVRNCHVWKPLYGNISFRALRRT